MELTEDQIFEKLDNMVKKIYILPKTSYYHMNKNGLVLFVELILTERKLNYQKINKKISSIN